MPEDFECSDVLDGLQKLSQKEIAVSMDELMSRRKPGPDRLKYMIALWRQDRTAWRNAQDQRSDRKEGIEE